jgi:hypothetical protein
MDCEVYLRLVVFVCGSVFSVSPVGCICSHSDYMEI